LPGLERSCEKRTCQPFLSRRGATISTRHALYLKPETRYPKHEIRNLTPETRNLEHGTPCCVSCSDSLVGGACVAAVLVATAFSPSVGGGMLAIRLAVHETQKQKPETRNLKPGARTWNPKPETRNPKSETQKPETENRNPKNTETRTQKPSSTGARRPLCEKDQDLNDSM